MSYVYTALSTGARLSLIQSPLSMVGDHRSPGAKRLKRRTSWKDTIRGLAGVNEEDNKRIVSTKQRRKIPPGLRTPARRNTFVVPRSATSDDQGVLADADTDEAEDFNELKEEERPIQARVRYTYPYLTTTPLPLSGSTLEKQQRELCAAVTEANNKASVEVASGGKRKEPIGTRLTMTSRTGYFQDRIISPSMVRISLQGPF